MFDSIVSISLTVAAIGAGPMAGVYFAFSGFVMRSLDQLGANQATEAMNSINKVILHSWFMVLFFGSTLLYAILSVIAAFDTDLAGRWLVFTSGLIYVFGMFVCTVVFNVPLNNHLANVSNDDNSKAKIWKLYYKQWTRWNHVRSVCSLMGLALSMYYLASYT